MASITIDSIDENLVAGLRARAGRHDRSVEEEILLILQERILQQEETLPSGNAGHAASRGKGLGRAIRDLFADVGGVELELPARELMGEPTRFE